MGLRRAYRANNPPIDYRNSELKAEVLDGQQRGGGFAATIVALMRRGANGRWVVATVTYEGNQVSGA